MPRGDDTRSDEQLVAGINAGDSTAFECLYYRYRDWVFRLAYRFTGNQDDSLDVLQETFAYLIRKFPGFELTSSMTTFLYPAVRNLSIAQRKKQQRHIYDGNALAAATINPDETNSWRDDLRQIVRSMPDAQREVLLMRFVDDMSLDEIATALTVPAGTVKSRLHYAIRALKQSSRLREYFDRDNEATSTC